MVTPEQHESGETVRAFPGSVSALQRANPLHYLADIWADFTPAEFFVYFCGTTGLVLLWHYLVFLLHDGHTKADDTRVYIGFLGVGPALTYFIFRVANRSNLLQGSPLGHALLFGQSILVLLAVASMWLGRGVTYGTGYLFSALDCGLVSAIVAINALAPAWLAYAHQVIFLRANKVMACVLPIVLCIHVVLWDPVVCEKIAHYWNATAFRVTGIASILAGLGLCLFGARLQRQLTFPAQSPFTSRVLSIASLVLLPLLLFDVHLEFEWLHYSAYMGPANAVLQGRLPLVDVHCQYGLCYLVYVLAFQCGVPHTYTGAALITSAANVLMYAAFLGILRKLVRHTWLVYVGGFLFVLFFHHYWHYDSTATPSVSGMRYLPQLLLLLAIVHVPQGRHLTVWTLSAALLCLFWSAESAVFGLGTYLIFLTVRGLQGKQRHSAIRAGLLLVALMTSSLVLVALALRLVSGAWPRFDFYFAFVNAYAFGHGDLSRLWHVSADLHFLEWLPVVLAYFLCAVFAVRLIAEGVGKHEDGLVHYAATLLAIAFLGVAQLSVFVGRSSWPQLLSASFPFALLFFATLDRVLLSAIDPATGRRRLAPLALTCLSVPALALMAAFSFAPMFEPERVGHFGPSLLSTWVASNSSAVSRRPKVDSRHHERWPSLMTTWRLLKSPDPDSRLAGAMDCCTPHWFTRRQRFAEAAALVRKWAPHEPALLLFLPESTQILFQQNKVHRYPCSCSTNERGVPALADWILNYPVVLHENDLVFVARRFEELQGLDQRILYKINSQWDTVLVDEMSQVLVYRLLAPSVPPVKGLRLPIVAVGATSSSEAEPMWGPTQATDGCLETFWSSATSPTPREEWLQIDLSSVQLIGQVRANPYPGSESLFPAHFVVEASRDLCHWETLAERSAFRVHSGQGFDVQFPALQARWVRLRGTSRSADATQERGPASCPINDFQMKAARLCNAGSYLMRTAEIMVFPPAPDSGGASHD
jgi:hypothetical protein